MMTSSNGNIIRVNVPLCGEFTGDNSPHKGQWRGALMFSLICAYIKGWANNREAGDLRHHCAHYDVIVMVVWIIYIGIFIYISLKFILKKLTYHNPKLIQINSSACFDNAKAMSK